MKKIIKLICLFVAFLATYLIINTPKAYAAEMPIIIDFGWYLDGGDSIEVAPSMLDEGNYTLDNFVEDYISGAVVQKSPRGTYLLKSDYGEYLLLDGFVDATGYKKDILTASSDSFSLSITDYKEIQVSYEIDGNDIPVRLLSDFKFYETCPLNFSSSDDYNNYHDVFYLEDDTNNVYVPGGVVGYLFSNYFDAPIYSSYEITEGETYVTGRFYEFRVICVSNPDIILNGYNTQKDGYYESGTNITATINPVDGKNVYVYNEDFNFDINYIGDMATITYQLYESYDISCIQQDKMDGNRRRVIFYIGDNVVTSKLIYNDEIFDVAEYDYILSDVETHKDYFMYKLEDGWAVPQVFDGQDIIVHLNNPTASDYYIWDLEFIDKDGNVTKPTDAFFQTYEKYPAGEYYNLSGSVYYDIVLECFLSLNGNRHDEIYVTVDAIKMGEEIITVNSETKFMANQTLSTISIYEVAVDEPNAITAIDGIGYVTDSTEDIRLSVKPGWAIYPDVAYELTDEVYIFKNIDVSNGYLLALKAEAAPVTIEFYTDDPDYEDSTRLDDLTLTVKVGDKLELPAVYEQEGDGKIAVYWQSNLDEYDMYDPYAIYTADGIIKLYPYTVERANRTIEVTAYKGESQVDSSKFSFKFSSSSYELKEINGGYVTEGSLGVFNVEFAADLDLSLYISIDGSEYFDMLFNEKDIFEYYYVGSWTVDNMTVSGNGWYEEGYEVTIKVTPSEGYKIEPFGTEYDKDLDFFIDEYGVLYCYIDNVTKSLELKFGTSVDNGTYSLYLMVEGKIFHEVTITENETDLADTNAILRSEEFISQYPGYIDSGWSIEDESFKDGKIVNPKHNLFGTVTNKSDYVMFDFYAYNPHGNIVKGDLETLELYEDLDNKLDVNIIRVGTKYYCTLPYYTDVFAYIGDYIGDYEVHNSRIELSINNPDEILTVYAVVLDSYEYVTDISGEGYYDFGQPYNLKFKEKEGYENFKYTNAGTGKVTDGADGYKTFTVNNGAIEIYVTADPLDVVVQFILGSNRDGGPVGYETTLKTGATIVAPTYEQIIGLDDNKMLYKWYFEDGWELNIASKCPYSPEGIKIYNDLIDCHYFRVSATIVSDEIYEISNAEQIKLSSSRASLVETSCTIAYDELNSMFVVRYNSETAVYAFVDYKSNGNYVYIEPISTNDTGMEYSLVEVYTKELEHVSCETVKFCHLGDYVQFTYIVEKGYTILINQEDHTLEEIDETTFIIKVLADSYKEVLYSVDYQTYTLTFLLEEEGAEIVEYSRTYKYLDEVVLPTSLPYSYEILQDTKLFLGWNKIISTMPNSNTTLYATYSQVLSSLIRISFAKTNSKVYSTDADIKISSSADTLIDITRSIISSEFDDTYLIKYPSTTPSLWIKMPGDSDYRYIDIELENNISLDYIYVEIEDNENYSRGGEGYYLANTRVELTISPNIGYSVQATGEYVIYNGIIAFDAIAPVSVGISVSQIEYYIMYYVNDEYYDIQTGIHYNDVIEMLTFEKKGFSFSGWDRIIDVMPAENVVVYGTYTTRIEVSITLNYNDSTLVNEDSLYLSNSYDIGGSVLKGEIDGNTISFAYTGKMYLWLYDSYLGGYKYIYSPLDGDVDLSLYLVSSEASTHYHLNGLGYYPVGSTAVITPVVDDGYYLTYEGQRLDSDIIITNITSNKTITCNASKETYKIYYYVAGELYHEDSYEYDQDVVMASYEWDGSDYERWNQLIFKMPSFNINIYAVERASAFMYQMPTVTVHKDSFLTEAIIEGGIVFIGDNIEDGEFKFKDSDTIITAEGSYKISFIPSNPVYKEYIFDVNVLVCNPMYSNELIDPEIIEITTNSIKLAINSHYEYRIDDGAYYPGGIVDLRDLKDNTSYRIEYRYMQDSNYCPSKSKSIVVTTLSANEQLYNETVAQGNEMLAHYERLIDNEAIQRYLAIYKADLRKGFDSTDSYFGAKLQQKISYIERVLEFTYNIELKRNESLLNRERIDNFTDCRLNEIISLAFENNTAINSIELFSNYVISVFDSSNSLISAFGLSFKPIVATSATNKNEYNQEFVTDKIDELLDYGYDSYSLINLNDYTDNYVTKAALMINSSMSQIHTCDGETVRDTVNDKINVVSAKTYLDYSFDRAEYDREFFEAAQIAIIMHVQEIVLSQLHNKYEERTASLKDTKLVKKYEAAYLNSYLIYSEYDSFKAVYDEILANKDESFTYDMLLDEFDSKIDSDLKLKNESKLSDVEILIIFTITVAVIGCGAAIIIRRRRYAK